MVPPGRRICRIGAARHGRKKAGNSMSEETRRPGSFPAWETLPDFGLYMDQLLTFTERCFPGEVTPGMINSYVKAGIVERPAGKKYSRTALAQLLMVCALKSALPLDSLRRLLHPSEEADTAALYEQFLREWDELNGGSAGYGDADALRCAISAACFQTRCRELLDRDAQSTEA